MSLRVLVFNVWGTPVSKNRKKRMNGICNVISQNEDSIDIVCFIELWMKSDRNAVIQAGKEGGLVHNVFFRNGSGFPGGQSSGLVLLSRWPIENSFYHRFSSGGKAHKLLHWDYGIFSGKGIGYAQIRGPKDIGLIDIFPSHFVAYYTQKPEDDMHDEYMYQRRLQAWEASQFIRNMSHKDRLVLCCLDMNASEKSLTNETMFQLTGMRDSWDEAGRPRENVLPDALWDIECKGYTCEHPGNCYTSNIPAARVDYIMWKPPMIDKTEDGTTHTFERISLTWCERRFSGLDDTVDSQVSLSDHSALLACFSVAREKIVQPIHFSKSEKKIEQANYEKLSVLLTKLEQSSLKGISDSEKRNKVMLRCFYISVFLLCIIIWYSNKISQDFALISPFMLSISVAAFATLAFVSFALGHITIADEFSAFVFMHDSIKLQKATLTEGKSF